MIKLILVFVPYFQFIFQDYFKCFVNNIINIIQVLVLSIAHIVTYTCTYITTYIHTNIHIYTVHTPLKRVFQPLETSTRICLFFVVFFVQEKLKKSNKKNILHNCLLFSICFFIFDVVSVHVFISSKNKFIHTTTSVNALIDRWRYLCYKFY